MIMTQLMESVGVGTSKNWTSDRARVLIQNVILHSYISNTIHISLSKRDPWTRPLGALIGDSPNCANHDRIVASEFGLWQKMSLVGVSA